MKLKIILIYGYVSPCFTTQRRLKLFLFNQLIKKSGSWYSIRVGMGTEWEVHVTYRVPNKFQLRIGSGMSQHGKLPQKYFTASKDFYKHKCVAIPYFPGQSKELCLLFFTGLKWISIAFEVGVLWWNIHHGQHQGNQWDKCTILILSHWYIISIKRSYALL